jgi:hypothetical protein
MNPFTKIWFWLLILSIIGFILSFIFFESMGQTTAGNTSTPAWIWVIFVLSIIFFVVAFILYAVDVAAYHRRMEIAEACGELPPPPPKKKIECPKKECVEKKIIECTEVKPKKDCDGSVKITTEVTKEEITKVATVNPSSEEIIKVVPIGPTQEEAFSAASLKPLASLAPPSSPTTVTVQV